MTSSMITTQFYYKNEIGSVQQGRESELTMARHTGIIQQVDVTQLCEGQELSNSLIVTAFYHQITVQLIGLCCHCLASKEEKSNQAKLLTSKTGINNVPPFPLPDQTAYTFSALKDFK